MLICATPAFVVGPFSQTQVKPGRPELGAKPEPDVNTSEVRVEFRVHSDKSML